MIRTIVKMNYFGFIVIKKNLNIDDLKIHIGKSKKTIELILREYF